MWDALIGFGAAITGVTVHIVRAASGAIFHAYADGAAGIAAVGNGETGVDTDADAADSLDVI